MIYNKKYLIQYLVGLLAMVALMKVTGGAGFVVMIPLLLMASFNKKPETLIFLLIMSIAMLIGNSNLMPKGQAFGYAQRISMLLLSVVMVTQIAGLRTCPLLKPFLTILPYLGWMTLSSLLGWCPFISYLKLFLFTMVFFAYYGIANMVSVSPRSDFAKMRSALLALAIFFIFGSVALLPFPGISQMGTEEIIAAIQAGENIKSLFKGMTFHSQALGPVCAILGVALLADMVFGIKRPNKLYLILLVCVPVLIWKTSSRTAMGTFVAGVAVCVTMTSMARNLTEGWKRRVVRTTWMCFICMLVASLAVPTVRNKLAGFVLKYGDEAKVEHVTTEDVLRTRRSKWDEGIYNFKQSPLFGNGFQVSREMKSLKPSINVLSAPIEKSIWISAVLEEGGLVGFLLFFGFFLIVIFSLFRRGAYIGLSLFLGFSITNLGEFTFFSMSGGGGFFWALVFIGISLDAKRIGIENQPIPRPNWMLR